MRSSHTLVDQDQLIKKLPSRNQFLDIPPMLPRGVHASFKTPIYSEVIAIEQFTQVYKGNACNLDFGLAEVSQHPEAVVYIYTLDYTLAGARSDRERKIDP